MRKEIGKIKRAEFGFGGYKEAQLGFTFDLGSDGWGVGDFKGQWGTEWSEHCKWSHEDRLNRLGNDCWSIRNILRDAKVERLSQLVGKPVEVTFDGMMLHSWRILTEAI